MTSLDSFTRRDLLRFAAAGFAGDQLEAFAVERAEAGVQVLAAPLIGEQLHVAGAHDGVGADARR